jgi:adenosylcobinamide-GDP ribazoletransferase
MDTGRTALLKYYLYALSFLTVMPLPPASFSADGRELSRAASFFPLAGATLGLPVAVFAFLALLVFPQPVVAALILILGFFLTRGLHLDGLADTADGLIGTTSRDKAFQAMDDSAVGVMGAVAIFFTYLLKFTLLLSLETAVMPLALLLMPLAGRWAIVNAGVWFAPARQRGLGDLFLRGLRLPQLLWASLSSLILLALIYIWQTGFFLPALVGCLAALAAGFLLALYAARRLGGISGDILGACSEVGELFFLLGFYLILHDFQAAVIIEKAVIPLVQGF